MGAEKDPLEKSSGSSKLMLVIIIVLVVAVLGEGGYIGYSMFFVKEKKGSKSSKSEAKEKKSRRKSEESEPLHSKSALGLEPFLVNLADTPQNRYARITLKLGLSMTPEHAAGKVAKNEVVISRIRDEIISILCSKRSDQIMTEEGKQMLRKEIIERTNRALPEGNIEEVFFTDFMVQL